MKRIDQMAPWYGDEEKKAMAEYLESGGWLTEFKKTREFEQMIAGYTSSKHCSVVSNGTVSLMIALWALDIKSGDEVIVPDFTMIASANAVALVGATPVLVDINPQTLCLDLKATEAAITRKTKAIMYVNINGRFPDIEEFVALARNRKLFLVEDAAQALGSRHKGKHSGTYGIAGSFSFSYPKVITTGQGGALVTDDEEVFQKIWRIRDFGRSKGGIDYHETMGLNAKFTDIQAVIGIEQMKKLEWRVKRKKEMFSLYRKLLADVEQIKFMETDLKDCSPWFIDCLVKGREVRDKLAHFLNENGVGTRPFYPAIHTQPPYSNVRGSFLNAVQVSEEGLWLPSSSFLTDEEVSVVCEAVRQYFQEEGR